MQCASTEINDWNLMSTDFFLKKGLIFFHKLNLLNSYFLFGKSLEKPYKFHLNYAFIAQKQQKRVPLSWLHILKPSINPH